MARIFKDRWWTLAALLACLPLAVFAYLGTFSRLIYDDYCFFGTGLNLNPWENVLHWRAYQNGHYSNIFLHGLLAPVGAVAVRILPAVVILLWLFGLYFLARRAVSYAGIEKQRTAIAIALAGAVVSATINGSFWQQVIFWYTASVAYALPLALLTIYAGLMWELLIRPEERMPPLPLIAAGAAVCFLNAGFAAFHMVVQLGIFSLAIPSVLAFVPKRLHRPSITVIGSGWLATIASLFVQLSAPGVTLRAQAIAEKWGIPDRSLNTLLSRTAKELFLASQKPELLAGIVFVFALGMILALMLRLRDQPLSRAPFRLSRAPIMFGLCIQLLFIPLLWSHTSDMPQQLGRFSNGYMTVIIVNAILVLIFTVLVIGVHRVNSALARHAGSRIVIPCATLLVVVMLFVLTQFRSIHWQASSYIYFTIHLLLLVLAWQLAVPLLAARSRRFAAFAAWAFASSWAASAPVALATVYTLPVVPERVLIFLSFSLVLNGLIWGLFLGLAIRRLYTASPIEKLGHRFLLCSCLVIFSVIGMGIAAGQMRHAPLLSSFAGEWDARHHYIMAHRELGQPIVVDPLSSNLREFMRHNASDIPCADDYYRVDVVITNGP